MSRLWTPEEWADILVEQHREFYRRNPRGQLPQTCIALTETGTYHVIECGWDGWEDRTFKLGLLRIALMSLKTIRYAFFAEAWYVAGAAAKAVVEDREAGIVEPIADMAERQECVFTLVVDRGREKEVFIRHTIVRGRNGGVRKLEPIRELEESGGGELSWLIDRESYQ